eukprot:TRINITY_DN30884_c0_g1_i1.p1 TRINITY_DN30884_c0_g1~~TRINITY_DN30884_c0_g1_i1.p1  ORF type:complete len:660 (+),score=91.39 TRINITY_DN30884_c0_g1_i1:101-2080(+)
MVADRCFSRCDLAREKAEDVSVGLLTGFVFWPIALSHALLAGVPPQLAAGTAVVAPLCYTALGTLPLMAIQTGATAALCVAEVIERAVHIGLEPAELMIVLSAMVACMYILLALLDLGVISEVFSQPLLRGRQAAATILVLMSTLKTLLGLPSVASDSIPLRSFATTASLLPQLHVPTAVMSAGLISLLATVGTIAKVAASHASEGSKPQDQVDPAPPKVIGKCSDPDLTQYEKPPASSRFSSLRCCSWQKLTRGLCASLSAALPLANLLVLTAGAITYWAIDDKDVQAVAHIDSLVPSFRLPRVSLDQIIALLPSAALIAFMIFGSHFVVVERIRRPTDRLDPRRELFALGASSLAAAIIGGIPPMPNMAVSQALRRGSSRVAAVAMAFAHAVAFYLAAEVPAFRFVPACAVSAILFWEFAPLLLVSVRDVKYLLKQAWLSRRSDALLAHHSESLRVLVASDFGIYVAGLLSPLVFGLIYGSVAAIVLELLLAMTRFAGASFSYIGRVPGTNVYDEIGAEDSGAVSLHAINIVRPSTSRWFGNIGAMTRLARKERRASESEIMVSLVDLRMVAFFDETALAHYKREWSRADLGVRILVSNACAHVRRQLKESGLAAILQQSDDTLVDLHAAVQCAEKYVREVEAARNGGCVRRHIRAA